MKSKILSVFAGIAMSTVTVSMAQSILTYNASPTIGTTNTTFTFNLFDSDLGTLTAVDLILNSSVAGGSITVDTEISGESATVSSVTSFLRTSGTGLTNQNTTSVPITFNPGLPYVQPADTFQFYNVTGSQSLISSPQTYAINPLNWSSYQVSGGVGTTPNFTGRTFTNITLSSDSAPATSNAFYTAASSYTLRYTYTPSGPVPVPEPGQVAASLLLLSGIGAYVFIKRRKKSAPAAA